MDIPAAYTQNEVIMFDIEIVKEIEDAFYDIPFENSQFQTENFVIAASITPERAYRSIGLRMFAKLRALNDAKFSRMRMEVDLEELEEKIQDPNTNKFDKRRAEIDIEEKRSSLSYTNKLINDAVVELNVLYKHFKSLPKFTREQFEMGERRHFDQRLSRQVLGLDGAKESIINMNEDIKAMVNFEEEFVKLGYTPESFEELKSLTLSNMISNK